jgi:hypothetical protein
MFPEASNEKGDRHLMTIAFRGFFAFQFGASLLFQRGSRLSLHAALVLPALVGGLFMLSLSPASGADQQKPKSQIGIDPGHPWRPPFGLERVGRPLMAVVEVANQGQPPPECFVVGYRQGKEIARSRLTLAGKPPYRCRVSFDPWPTELALFAKSAEGAAVELARKTVVRVPFEAAAAARPDRVIHPVDLGTVLVPNDWLLLAHGQKGTVDVAAICRSGDVPSGRVTAWFASAPAAKTVVPMPLRKDRRAQVSLALPPAPASIDHDILHVSVGPANGAELSHQKIETMVVHQAPRWPEFGAVETKLRYDAPISLLSRDGKLSSMSYASGWDPKFKDVVVALPNGMRFVFWRGSCYIPFWVSRHNVGFNYEWAEGMPAADAVDCVEPLMDKELRYGRVRLVESTPARVHVRWTYQSCDFNYKVWGDSAIEDYYFYPDGFGTRVLTLQSDPKTANYELSELILLTPQSTYPLSIFPSKMVDILFVDGQKREITFPYFAKEQGAKMKSRNMPAIYRVRLHKDEPLAAIYFNPLDANLPGAVFYPFFDKGELVTSFYWGSHWPLARGKTTGYAIDSRVSLTPCHNSIISWQKNRPTALRTAQFQTIDTLGRSKLMQVQTWAWLIGMSDAGDARLLQWADSYSTPPAVELQGARLQADSYVPERRAIRMIVDNKTVTIRLKPAKACVNPVFELSSAPKKLRRVELDGRVLGAKEYACDGKTLWINATMTHDTQLRLVFDDSPR